jgi:flagellin-like protein
MKYVNKKGVSPLIASVLLVGIVIVIAFLVFWWYGDYVADNLDKSDISADQACLQDVGFRITNVDCLQDSDDTNKIVYFDLENNGDIDLSAFKVSIDGNLANDVKSISQEVRQGVTSKLSFEYNMEDIGDDLSADIIPLIWAGGITKYCTDKTQTINIVCLPAA